MVWRGRRKRGTGGRADVRREIDRLVSKLIPRDEIRLARIRTVWPHAATERVAARTWPARFRGGKLVVHVRDVQWLHELSYLQPAITERLRETQVDADEKLRMEFRVGRLPPPEERAAVPMPPPRPPALPLNPPPDTLEALNRIEDPELREAIAAARYVLGGGAQ
jgi:hypothetical protein